MGKMPANLNMAIRFVEDNFAGLNITSGYKRRKALNRNVYK